MSYKYPVYQPSLQGNEKKYVTDCLESTWISSKGKYIELFEKKFSEFVGVNYSAGVCNGTVALHAALLALNIGAGDEVIVPTFTYIASVNSIKYTGATPVFVDSDKETWQMDVNSIENKITPNTKAIMAVHIYGCPCEMDFITDICKKHNLYLIEDCAEAFGSKYKGKTIGTFGDVSTFSFFGNKTITTGEGGMISTNCKELYEKIIKLKGQGLAKGKEYYHDIIGYNYRMTNICAAIGYAQLERAEELIQKKREIAKWYKINLDNLPVDLPKDNGKNFNTFWMYNILVKNSRIRNSIRDYLKEAGIETRPSFHPVHSMPMYYEEGLSFPVADELGSRGINLPSYPDLKKEDIYFISNQIRKFFVEK